jgi:hypothetical protein
MPTEIIANDPLSKPLELSKNWHHSKKDRYFRTIATNSVSALVALSSRPWGDENNRKPTEEAAP